MWSDILNLMKSAITAVSAWFFDIVDKVGALGLIAFLILVSVFFIRVIGLRYLLYSGSDSVKKGGSALIDKMKGD